MTIEAVLWDVDGTLVDSEPLHMRALLAVCAEHGVDISDLPDDAFVGVNLPGVWQALGPRYSAQLTMARWIDRIKAHYVAGAETLAPMPGAARVIRALHARGVRQAAVSNSNRVVVDTNINLLGTAECLEFCLSLDDVAQGKPHPELYRAALVRLDLAPDRALAIEDSLTGILSARAAGICTVGYRNPDLPADAAVSELDEVMELVTREPALDV